MVKIGGINLGKLTEFSIFVSDGSSKAKIQSSSPGYSGDWAVNGLVAEEDTSGNLAYGGNIYTNATGPSAFGKWQDILDNNVGQAFGVTGQTDLINGLKSTLNQAFLDINALPVSAGFNGVSANSLNGLNTTNKISETFVVNITNFSVSSPIRITGDPDDVFIFRWDTDANFSNGYDGEVKFSGGNGFVPLGGLSPANFIHVAGDINTSGGGKPPTDFNFPQGPRLGNGQGDLVSGSEDWPDSQGGGFFTGYWLTTGKPDNAPDANHSVYWGKTSSQSNGRIVGGWYTITNDFTLTSGTAAVYVGPVDYGDLPQPKYKTTRSNNGPGHVITDTLFLGTNFDMDIDPEGDGQPNATATGDNLANLDDETAVTIPTLLAGQNATFNVEVTNKTGKNATLYGFIDWNMDGDFADTGETATKIVANNTMGNVTLPFNVPANAVLGMDLGARFRLSTATGLGPTDPQGANGPIPAPDGEVEDYLVKVQQPTAKLGDFVWEDLNANGLQEAGEPGINGVTVKLLDASGATLQTTTTGAGTNDPNTPGDESNGYYEFSGLTPGVGYTVMFVNPDDEGPDAYMFSEPFAPTGMTPAQNPTTDSNVIDTINGTTTPVFLIPDEFDRTIDAGLFRKGSIGDFVWNDLNANGIQNAGEPGINGVTVKLLDATTGATLQTTTTGAGTNDPNTPGDERNGYYEFTGLTPGVNYKVMFTQPTGFNSVSPFQAGNNPAIDSDANPDDGLMSDVVVLESGEFNRTIDAGFYNTAKLGDFIWEDLNANGLQEAGEPGINGVTVKLLDATTGAILQTTTTGAGTNDPTTPGDERNGYYQFTGLTPGVGYTVMFVNPDDEGPDAYMFSKPFAPTGMTPAQNPTTDSNVIDPINGTTTPVFLTSGEFDRTIDAGLFRKGSIGDFVWNDLNANGLQEADEPGINGVTVKLLDATTGATLQTTTTGAGTNDPTTPGDERNGYYQFTGLTPGVNYKVMFTQPAGFNSVSPFQAGNNPAIDSDANPDDGLMSDVVVLESGEFNRTIDAGFYNTAKLGDFVWLDKNANGIQNAGEPGINGVTVKLLDATTGAILQTTTTGAGTNDPTTPGDERNGYYEFTGLTPGVEYKVMFVNPDDEGPDAYMFSPQYAPTGVAPGQNPTIDSNADPENGMTDIVTLTSGEFNRTIDAGLFRKGSIHAFGFLDENGDGKLNHNEGAFPDDPGKTLVLQGDVNGDGISETVTQKTVDGMASFEGLTPGTYTLREFPIPNGYTLTTTPNRRTFTVLSGQELVYANGAANLPPGDQRTEINIGRRLQWGNAPETGDLEIIKTANRYQISPGENITYTITVSNTGQLTATNAQVVDMFSTALTNVTWTSEAFDGATNNEANGSGDIDDLVTLPSGSRITYTVVGTLAPVNELSEFSLFDTGVNGTNLGQSITTLNGVTADAFYYNGPADYQATNNVTDTVLWQRNQRNDRGLGVISDGETLPTNNGDVNEISNQLNKDVLRLAKADEDQWRALWVSSLDQNGTGGAEKGRVYWSNDPTPNLDTLINGGQSFAFEYGDFGTSVEGNILTLTQASGFDLDAEYVFFTAGLGTTDTGTNNDYLVWQATTTLTNTAMVTPPPGFTDNNPNNNMSTVMTEIVF